MDAAVTAAVVAASVALFGAFIAAAATVLTAIFGGGATLATAMYSSRAADRAKRLEAQLAELALAEQRRHETAKTAARYHEPLLRAAYDLQSRLYNIIKQNLIGAYVTNGTSRSRDYVVDNTTFLIAQYCAWTEIARREVRFIDLGQDAATLRLSELQDAIYSVFQTDNKYLSPFLRLFAGEQRELGELLIQESPQGIDCAGPHAFRALLATSHPLVDSLRTDVRALETQLPAARPRLVALQNALIDLMFLLDPTYIRFPAKSRSKVA